ncbi:MAG: hypothetical protein JSS43_28555 [Proteobacteria bacterium]|nr:hypothetical protein [Pseudomonadota bacterium]
MTDEFVSVWLKIRSMLDVGATVRNWGQSRGYTGGGFRIADVSNTFVAVTGGRIVTERRISKGEFRKIHAVWAEYRARTVMR